MPELKFSTLSTVVGDLPTRPATVSGAHRDKVLGGKGWIKERRRKAFRDRTTANTMRSASRSMKAAADMASNVSAKLSMHRKTMIHR